ncbi:hypothetical protein GCM10010282_64070 [Streptomyces roseolus]|nr:hypothetical protein GCM10010282_64070 [Streptomyces roseolus]
MFRGAVGDRFPVGAPAHADRLGSGVCARRSPAGRAERVGGEKERSDDRGRNTPSRPGCGGVGRLDEEASRVVRIRFGRRSNPAGRRKEVRSLHIDPCGTRIAAETRRDRNADAASARR